jgi:hypothetical protein
VDEVHIRSQSLADTIRISIQAPELTALYDNGIPEVHKEEFQYFLALVLKACRIMRDFGVVVN